MPELSASEIVQAVLAALPSRAAEQRADGMIAADRPDRPAARLCAVDAGAGPASAARGASASCWARRSGRRQRCRDPAGEPARPACSERRADRGAAGRLASRPGDPTRFAAVVFGAGDYRIRTEDRPLPPALSRRRPAGARAAGGVVERCWTIRGWSSCASSAAATAIWAGLARHGRPIQYAHVPQPLALWDVWTRIAADPVAFEPPSAGFALDWALLAAWRGRGVGFATLTHAAGISSTGDAGAGPPPALRRALPHPGATAAAIARREGGGGRVVAHRHHRGARPGSRGGARRHGAGRRRHAANRIGPGTGLRVVDAILSGMHQPGKSHFELLRAFAPDGVLDGLPAALPRRAIAATSSAT